jgi:hypothetical protein
LIDFVILQFRASCCDCIWHCWPDRNIRLSEQHPVVMIVVTLSWWPTFLLLFVFGSIKKQAWWLGMNTRNTLTGISSTKKSWTWSRWKKSAIVVMTFSWGGVLRTQDQATQDLHCVSWTWLTLLVDTFKVNVGHLEVFSTSLILLIEVVTLLGNCPHIGL